MPCTINAGSVPGDHWVQDAKSGGGRIIGEVCHFLDLMNYWTGSLIKEIYAISIGSLGENEILEDKTCITIKFKNGSLGTINYFANGASAYIKERFEIFSNGKTGILSNFKKYDFFNGAEKRKGKGRSQEKGHYQELHELIEAIENGKPLSLSFDEILNASRASIAAVESIKTGKPVKV
jgi:predicted dehydrogenase